MKHINLIIGLSLLSLASAAAAADDKERSSRLETLDSNGDGNINFVEFQEAATLRQFDRLNSDGNDVITLDEFLNGRSGRGRRGAQSADQEVDAERRAGIRERLLERATNRFHEMDLDGDEMLTLTEVQEATFLALDRDGNGLLNGRELRGSRRGGPGLYGRGPDRRAGRREQGRGKSAQN